MVRLGERGKPGNIYVPYTGNTKGQSLPAGWQGRRNRLGRTQFLLYVRNAWLKPYYVPEISIVFPVFFIVQ